MKLLCELPFSRIDYDSRRRCRRELTQAFLDGVVDVDEVRVPATGSVSTSTFSMKGSRCGRCFERSTTEFDR